MMSFFTRVWNLFSAAGDGADCTVAMIASPSTDQQAAPAHYPIEHETARQREQLDRAVSLLQRSAFLARYHQPSLERDIRSLVAEINASRADGASAAHPQWTAASTAGHYTA